MARTKKQTIESASERKRQIQEEILRESLGSKSKGAKPANATCLAKGGNSRAELQVTSESGSSFRPLAGGVIRGAVNDSTAGQSSPVTAMPMNRSSPTRSQSTMAAAGIDLPQAVIRITDICKSPSIGTDDEFSLRNSRESSPRVTSGLTDQACSKSRSRSSSSESAGRKHRNGKLDPKLVRVDMDSSLKTLKDVSKKARRDKNEKHFHSAAAGDVAFASKSGVGTERKSKKQQSSDEVTPKLSTSSRTSRSSSGAASSKSTGSTRPLRLTTSDRPKINIFTDNLGVELGKRIRSPRRLSEDMIALPIYSVRRWNTSPKDGIAGAINRTYEDETLSDTSSPLARTPNGSEGFFKFKTPEGSVSSRRSSAQNSPQKSPSSSASPGSPHKTPPSWDAPRKSDEKRRNSSSPLCKQQLGSKLSKLSPQQNTCGALEDCNTLPKSGVSDLKQIEKAKSYSLRKPVDTSREESSEEKVISKKLKKNKNARNVERQVDPANVKSEKETDSDAELEARMASICRGILTDEIFQAACTPVKAKDKSKTSKKSSETKASVTKQKKSSNVIAKGRTSEHQASPSPGAVVVKKEMQTPPKCETGAVSEPLPQCSMLCSSNTAACDAVNSQRLHVVKNDFSISEGNPETAADGAVTHSCEKLVPKTSADCPSEERPLFSKPGSTLNSSNTVAEKDVANDGRVESVTKSAGIPCVASEIEDKTGGDFKMTTSSESLLQSSSNPKQKSMENSSENVSLTSGNEPSSTMDTQPSCSGWVEKDMKEEQPSLLCAMLVGGTEVTKTYNQERERYRPLVVEISDSETELSRASTPVRHLHSSSNLVQVESKLVSEPSERTVKTELEADGSREVKSSVGSNVQGGNDCTNASNGVAVKTNVSSKTEDNVTGIDNKGDEIDSSKLCPKIECDVNGPWRDGGKENSEKDSWKKMKIEYSSLLRTLDEGVLKLLDVEFERQFINADALDNNLTKAEETKGSDDRHSKLYDLISVLALRLKEREREGGHSIDSEKVDKLLYSCPKTAKACASSSEVEILNELRKRKIRLKLAEEKKLDVSPAIGARDASCCNGQSEPIVPRNTGKEADEPEVQNSDSVVEEAECSIAVDEASVKLEPVPGETVGQQQSGENQCSFTASSSSLCDSLCDIDVDAITSAATTVMDIDNLDVDSKITGPLSERINPPNVLSSMEKEVYSVENSNGMSFGEKRGPEMPSQDSIHHTKTPHSRNALSVVENTSPCSKSESRENSTDRRVLYKAKTCGDFSHVPTTDVTPGTLRRVNSSPQLDTKAASLGLSSANSLPNLTKEGTVKSKLGSKIPVPGSIQASRSSRKSWRTPRAITEPKPLWVLSQLESTTQAKHPFLCPSLQKYLMLPSNRVIVPYHKRKEMELADAIAIKQAEEHEVRERMQKARERIQENSQRDEDLDEDFARVEPDFDEVEGMLFMSFSDEVELRAHVNVEKALEWDRDDTMLRISRAKAFEEAKALHGDMQGFKLKHLRGQHMRWKKYRRLYSQEVKTLQEAKRNGIPLENVTGPKKTSDISKIKGCRKKQTEATEVNENFQRPCSVVVKTFEDPVPDSGSVPYSQGYFTGALATHALGGPGMDSLDEDVLFVGEGTLGEGEKRDLSPRSRRRQGFSDQKAHKQLFRELNMDWEDRMIHRKLGGWSLKGNRPRAFSKAAIKRMEKVVKEGVDNDLVSPDVKPLVEDKGEINSSPESKPPPATQSSSTTPSLPADSSQGEQELEFTPEGTKDALSKKRKPLRLIYPLLTERMARNALKTLELGDISKRKRKRKRRDSNSKIPALMPIPTTPQPPSTCTSLPLTPSSTTATLGSSPAEIATPKDQMTSASASTANTPLELDVREEPVMEGVDLAADASGSSLHSSPQSKTCSKPGCRYGCICHLCFVNEEEPFVPSSPQSAKPSVGPCDKEYCRLGCICDSIDHEKPVPSQDHCRKPSCMLGCECSELGGLPSDSNDGIPYLPSMKRRPKPGERFSNLPQREKTHRSAKNLDAITRKAMMLYETSEIYCEKVERTKKRSEASSQPEINISPVDSPRMSPTMMNNISPAPGLNLTDTESFDMAPFQQDPPQPNRMLFNAVNLVTSKVSPIAASHLSPAETTQDSSLSSPAVAYEGTSDVRQVVLMVEPSAHKRKRKSHPLSDEIFMTSTCARTQPNQYKRRSRRPNEMNERSPVKTATSSLLKMAGKDHEIKSTDETQNVDPGTDADVSLKITSVTSLAAPGNAVNASIEEMKETALPVNNTEQASQSADEKSGCELKKSGIDNSKGSTKTSTEVISAVRPQHGWHTSMVCLKARAPPKASDIQEDDVQEEDDVKLLEFAANCNWEGAKKEILGKVAQCLTRGQYPHPRTMIVCEFVVEILPKAHQPSLIPPELRAKLPNQMYSIRVRITRRESSSESESVDLTQVIDLSESSPVKKQHHVSTAALSKVQSKSRVAMFNSLPSGGNVQITGNAMSSSLLTQASAVVSRSPLSVASQSHLAGEDQVMEKKSFKSHSAPGSRRSSTEVSSNEKDSAGEDAKSKNSSCTDNIPSIKIMGSSFVNGKYSGTGLKATIGSMFSGSMPPTVTNTKAPPSSVGGKPVNSQAPAVAALVPLKGKDVHVVKLPRSDGVMQLMNRDKQIITMPISLAGAESLLGKPTVPLVAVGVSDPQGRPKVVPVVGTRTTEKPRLSVPHQVLLRVPLPSSSGSLMHQVMMKPVEGSPLMKLIHVPTQHQQCCQSSLKEPSAANSSLTSSPALTTATVSSAMGCVPSPCASVPVTGAGGTPEGKDVPAKTADSDTTSPTSCADQAESVEKEDAFKVQPPAEDNSEETIMVFKAAHIKNREIIQSLVSSKPDKSSDVQPESAASWTDEKSSGALSEPKEIEREDVPVDFTETLDECDGYTCVASESLHVSVQEETVLTAPVGADIVDATCVQNSSDDLNTACVNAEAVECNSAHPESSCANGEKEVLANVAALHKIQEFPVPSPQLSLTVENVSTLDGLMVDGPCDIISDLGTKFSNTQSVPASAVSSNERHEDLALGRDSFSGKRSQPASPEMPDSLPAKKVCVSPVPYEEDSNPSLCSSHGLSSCLASPLSVMSRSKSNLSSTLSTGSSDDIVVTMSSDEEIEVVDGGDGVSKAFLQRAERALNNDHASLYKPFTKPVSCSTSKRAACHSGHPVSECPEKSHCHTQVHNERERRRRSMLNALFNDLKELVIHELDMSPNENMSKCNILKSAQLSIGVLQKALKRGDQKIAHYTSLNHSLKLRLAMLQKRASDETRPQGSQEPQDMMVKVEMPSPALLVSEQNAAEQDQLTTTESHRSTPDTRDLTDTVDLVSPSSDSEKNSTGDENPPVYEDISDCSGKEDDCPEYEDISDPEVAMPEYEDISEPETSKEETPSWSQWRYL